MEHRPNRQLSQNTRSCLALQSTVGKSHWRSLGKNNPFHTQDSPLTLRPPSSDPQDLEPLTPSKLLLLCPNVCQSPRETGDVVSYASKRWKQAHYLADVFWKRWIRKYLPALQLKQKWLCPRPSLAVGDLVLVVDEASPRGHWPKAVEQEVFPDKHGIVRQVLVRTASSVVRRDVRKLCLLEGALFERD